MSDPRKQLASEWRESSRFGKYGEVISKVAIKGIRGHRETVIDFRSPITAITGLNGTGKSTILQLAAVAYNSPEKYTVRDFLCKGPLDATVFSDDASVHYELQGERERRPLTLSYNAAASRWQGYARRPTRTVFVGGVNLFLPRSEEKDFVFRNAAKLVLDSSSPLSDEVRGYIARILKGGYQSVVNNKVTHGGQKDDVLTTTRDGLSYSEAHMGCGEGRVLRMVSRLEVLPERSLIILEEPETSLHSSAEYEFGKYLMGLVIRKHHQILLTTHSSTITSSLPDASLLFLHRDSGTICPLPGIGSRSAASLLSEGFDKALTILVEDDAAEATLSELLRQHSPEFLRTVRIALAREKRDDGNIDASGKDAIRKTMSTLSEAGLKLVAVLDGNEQEEAEKYIYKLPGDSPPEEELYRNPAVKAMLNSVYKLDIAALDAELAGQDCHSYFKIIAQKADNEESFLIREAAREYARSTLPAEVRRLVELLKDAAQKK